MKSKTSLSGGAEFLQSPLRYPGSHHYALDTLLSLVPKHQVFIEPFCGGASEFFGKTKAETNWLNDIDKELIKVYWVLRDQPERLVAFLKRENDSEERYDYFKDSFAPKDDFEIAARWFYLNRTSVLSMMSRFWKRDD
ncbi:MAG: DNA adenine methylase, partial [archaeon]|nr:DNA adenine methylase [archaeon]